MTTWGKWNGRWSITAGPLELDPGYFQAMYNRAVVLGQAGRHQEAIVQFDKVIGVESADIQPPS